MAGPAIEYPALRPACTRRDLPRRRRQQCRSAIGRGGMDATSRPQAARASRRPRQLGTAGGAPAAGAAPLLLSARRAVAGPGVARSPAGETQNRPRDQHRRPALDLRRPADARRSRAAEAPAMKWLAAALLIVAAAAHLLLPLTPLRE